MRQNYSLTQIRQTVPGVDIDRVAEVGNQLARALGATEPWVRLRGDQVEVDDQFARFVQSAAQTSGRTGTTGTDATPGW